MTERPSEKDAGVAREEVLLGRLIRGVLDCQSLSRRGFQRARANELRRAEQHEGRGENDRALRPRD